MDVLAILNSQSGGLKSAELADLRALIVASFAESGKTADCRVFRGVEFDDFLSRSFAETDAETVLVAGGDGTVSTAAAYCLKHGKVLGVLPAGTMNLFARTLQLPLALEEAIRQLAAGTVTKCDIGTANGRPFIHQYSVGLQPKVVEERDRAAHGSRLTKMVAGLWAVVSALRRPPSFDVRIDRDGNQRRETVSFIAVSNNLYGEGHLPYADRTDEGLLGVYSAGRLSAKASLKLIADLARGAWANNPDFQVETATHAKLEFPGKKRGAKAVIDGELIALEEAVSIRIHPGALKVLKPPAAFESRSPFGVSGR